MGNKCAKKQKPPTDQVDHLDNREVITPAPVFVPSNPAPIVNQAPVNTNIPGQHLMRPHIGANAGLIPVSQGEIR